jgi:hypothetical protein
VNRKSELVSPEFAASTSLIASTDAGSLANPSADEWATFFNCRWTAASSFG